MIDLFFQNPISFLIYIVALFFTISIHEFAHAWTADFLGDPTPRLQGRLNLNPKSHLDPAGLLFLVFFGFGWGKPVEFDPYNLKNPRRDAAIIALAGPLSNFILALLLSIIFRLFIFFDYQILITIGYIFFIPLIQINVILGAFNLLPIHPLDGFKIVGGVLSDDQAKEWYSLQKYGFLFLLLLIIPITGSSMLDTVLKPIVNFFINILIPKIY
ncbi:MAG: peptidase [Patescibacteria group bacterium]|nr:MAG: peptidase [Patescibacteria group bacterium]